MTKKMYLMWMKLDFKYTPYKTMHGKCETCHESKKNKEHITSFIQIRMEQRN